MNNIYVLPTDKPSRLYFNTKAKYYAFSYTVTSQGGSVSNRHIYITNNEEIKEGDWCIDVIHNIIEKRSDDRYKKQYKKIILTTDQDLIKDGVQAIDDEFLQWFVKNPSCEFVNIYQYAYKKPDFGKYKIIIPKEETKQETLELKHLAPYLPYRLKGNYEVSEVVPSAKFELRNKELRNDNIDFFLSYAKPILRPLSDLTKEIEVNEKKFIPIEELDMDIPFTSDLLFLVTYGDVQKLLEWHFDVFELIQKGLAVDINTI
jgi:hypothetical protein